MFTKFENDYFGQWESKTSSVLEEKNFGVVWRTEGEKCVHAALGEGQCQSQDVREVSWACTSEREKWEEGMYTEDVKSKRIWWSIWYWEEKREALKLIQSFQVWATEITDRKGSPA